MAAQTPLSPPPPPPPFPPILPVGQLHAGVNPEKEEEDDEDPVPLMKQLGPCAKPYIALQVSDQDLGLQRLLLCVCELSYQHDVYNLSALWAAAAGLPDGY